jgi:hypothetical protein
MPETALSLNPHYVKDVPPVPPPPPRIGGLTRLLKELDVGESGVIPRRSSDDIYRLGRVLDRTFTARALNEETSRVWRLA